MRLQSVACHDLIRGEYYYEKDILVGDLSLPKKQITFQCRSLACRRSILLDSSAFAMPTSLPNSSNSTGPAAPRNLSSECLAALEAAALAAATSLGLCFMIYTSSTSTSRDVACTQPYSKFQSPLGQKARMEFSLIKLQAYDVDIHMTGLGSVKGFLDLGRNNERVGKPQLLVYNAESLAIVKLL